MVLYAQSASMGDCFCKQSLSGTCSTLSCLVLGRGLGWGDVGGGGGRGMCWKDPSEFGLGVGWGDGGDGRFLSCSEKKVL